MRRTRLALLIVLILSACGGRDYEVLNSSRKTPVMQDPEPSPFALSQWKLENSTDPGLPGESGGDYLRFEFGDGDGRVVEVTGGVDQDPPLRPFPHYIDYSSGRLSLRFGNGQRATYYIENKPEGVLLESDEAPHYQLFLVAQ